jgi:hypothetical protein
MDPQSKVDYSHITLKAGMVMKKALLLVDGARKLADGDQLV